MCKSVLLPSGCTTSPSQEIELVKNGCGSFPTSSLCLGGNTLCRILQITLKGNTTDKSGAWGEKFIAQRGGFCNIYIIHYVQLSLFKYTLKDNVSPFFSPCYFFFVVHICDDRVLSYRLLNLWILRSSKIRLLYFLASNIIYIFASE